MILGIDEVGRGAWAGPLVVGAVVLGGVKIDGITDSKKLSKKRREELDIIIRQSAKGIGLGWVDAAKLDEIGLSAALKLATKKAVAQIKTPYHEIIIDGTVNFLIGTNKEKYVKTLKQADLLIPSVSAASIVAKVARDNYMSMQSKEYTGYKFDRHVGYGTAAHSEAIKQSGLTKLHRLSFIPIKSFQKSQEKQTTKKIGDDAEAVAANHLVNLGHEILDRNWKTKYCEIDIVSRFNDVIYFTEVKYRKNADQGDGLAAVTKKKLNQMIFASKIYIFSNNVTDIDLRLSAMSVAGTPPDVIEFVEV